MDFRGVATPGTLPHARLRSSGDPQRGLPPGTPRARTDRHSFLHGDPSEAPWSRSSGKARGEGEPEAWAHHR